ncbi:unnamed protein product [Umbelopsis ramanniana]
MDGLWTCASPAYERNASLWALNTKKEKPSAFLAWISDCLLQCATASHWLGRSFVLKVSRKTGSGGTILKISDLFVAFPFEQFLYSVHCFYICTFSFHSPQLLMSVCLEMKYTCGASVE